MTDDFNILDNVTPIITDYVTFIPTQPGIDIAGTTVSSDATLKGGLYQTFQTIRFNRIWFDVAAHAGARTFRFLMYQDTQNDGVFRRICTLENFNPDGEGVVVATPTEDPITILPSSKVVVLWGEDGAGDIQLTCWATSAVEIYTAATQMPTGAIPTTFNTTISSSTSPATVDPTFGGADSFAGTSTADSLPVIRLNLA